MNWDHLQKSGGQSSLHTEIEFAHEVDLGAELILFLNFNFRIQISEQGRPLSVQPPVPGQPATDIKIQNFQFIFLKLKKSLPYGHVTRNIAVAQQTVTEGRNQEYKKNKKPPSIQPCNEG